ncbi:MAG: exodeoxyribonuclease VII small subunit [Clostridium sp.]
MATRKKEKNFEEAIERLEEIVSKMESEDLSLEESIKAFKEGMDLVSLCNARLDDAETKINVIMREKSGELKEDKFLPQEEI